MRLTWKTFLLSILLITIFILFLNISFTAPISGDNSISEIRRVDLNGIEQTIVLRGRDKTLPVLLWIDGGPGGTEIGWTRRYLSELENDFVFVNWDQAGTGKSYGTDISQRTIADYVADVISLSEYLSEFSSGSKIYIAGHSWGSILALQAVSHRPDLFQAYFAIGQFVNAVENDNIVYEMVMADSLEKGNFDQLLKFRSYGPPPYNSDQLYIYDELYNAHNLLLPELKSDFNELQIFTATEQSIIDKINIVRGYYAMSKQFNDEINLLDMESSIKQVQVPVYFFMGRYDYSTNKDIAYRYFQSLDAPVKQYYWFENSTHYPCFEENRKFIEIVRNEVLNTID